MPKSAHEKFSSSRVPSSRNRLTGLNLSGLGAYVSTGNLSSTALKPCAIRVLSSAARLHRWDEFRHQRLDPGPDDLLHVALPRLSFESWQTALQCLDRRLSRLEVGFQP